MTKVIKAHIDMTISFMVHVFLDIRIALYNLRIPPFQKFLQSQQVNQSSANIIITHQASHGEKP